MKRTWSRHQHYKSIPTANVSSGLAAWGLPFHPQLIARYNEARHGEA